jgi:hypothetical protein
MGSVDKDKERATAQSLRALLFLPSKSALKL